MDMGAIAGAQTAIKALLVIARGAMAATVDNKVKDRLIDVQSAVLDIQARLGDAQAERFELMEQVAELRTKLRAAQEVTAALQAYELVDVGDGKFLYGYKAGQDTTPDHFACPTCHSNGKVSVLQSAKSGSQQRLYACKACTFSIYVGPSDPTPPPRRINYPGFVRNW